MKKLIASALLVASAATASAQIQSIDAKSSVRNDFGLGVGITADLTDNIEFSHLQATILRAAASQTCKQKQTSTTSLMSETNSQCIQSLVLVLTTTTLKILTATSTSF